jgi:hypothetical protein
MTRLTSFSTVGSQFDNFLFSPIGEDRNDMPLSVLSALTRLDIDPWQEAAELARLPPETATQRLASSIAALPNAWPVHLEFKTIAARLVALLPRQASSEELPRHMASPGASPKVHADTLDMTKFRAGMYMYIVLTVVMLGAQWIAASHETLAQPGKAPAPAARSVTPPISEQ